MSSTCKKSFHYVAQKKSRGLELMIPFCTNDTCILLIEGFEAPRGVFNNFSLCWIKVKWEDRDKTLQEEDKEWMIFSRILRWSSQGDQTSRSRGFISFSFIRSQIIQKLIVWGHNYLHICRG